MKNPGNFEDDFRKSFENARIVPDNEVWGRVGHVMRAKRKKARLYRLALIAMICSFSLLTWLVFNFEPTKKPATYHSSRSNAKEAGIKQRNFGGSGKSVLHSDQNILKSPSLKGAEKKSSKNDPSIDQINIGLSNDNKNTNSSDFPVLISENGIGHEAFSNLPSAVHPKGFAQMGKPMPISLSMPALISQTGAAENFSHDKRDRWLQLSIGSGMFEPIFTEKNTTGAKNINLASAYSSSLLNNSSAPAVQYSASIQLGGDLSKRWKISVGVEGVRQNLKMEVPVSYVVSNPTANGNPYKAVMNDSQLRVLVKTRTNNVSLSNTYLGIPIEVYYRACKTKLALDFVGGFSVRYAAHSVLINDGDTYTTGFLHNPFEAFGINAKLGANLTYPIAPKWHICLMPSFERSLSSQIKNTRINLKPQAFEVGLGIRKSF